MLTLTIARREIRVALALESHAKPSLTERIAPLTQERGPQWSRPRGGRDVQISGLPAGLRAGAERGKPIAPETTHPLVVARSVPRSAEKESVAPAHSATKFRPLDADLAVADRRSGARGLTQSDLPAIASRVYSLFLDKVRREKRLRGL